MRDKSEGRRVSVEEPRASTTYTSEVERKQRVVDQQAVMPKLSTLN